MAESRRTFLKQSAASVAVVSLPGCAPMSAESPDALLPATLRAVGEAMLPEELGADGRERAVAAFELWSEGLEPVAEMAHPYLVPETVYTGPDPRPGWAAQLRGLDIESRKRFGASFGEVGVPERRSVLEPHVRRAGPDLGRPGNAAHVALALAAHFFASPIATDICYGRAIAKQQCRGLAAAGDEPAPLAGNEPAPMPGVAS